MASFGATENPLLCESPAVWDELIEAVGPASLLVVINARMSPALKKRVTPEDIWQEALLHVWRDRERFVWRGLRSFRSWLLTVIDHRIHDAADREKAIKRGGGAPPVPFSALESSRSAGGRTCAFPGPAGSTTPSRVAMHKEQAAAMRAALDALPADLRDVVHLRLFEQLKVEEVAKRLGIGASAVRHRFRKGAGLYQRSLMIELATRSVSLAPGNTNATGPVSSPDR